MFNGKGSLSTSFSKLKSGLSVSGRGPNSGLTSLFPDLLVWHRLHPATPLLPPLRFVCFLGLWP